jgi:hypothetical protein
VVFGTYTTSWLPGGNTPLNGTLALALAGAVTVRAWVVCVRQSAPAPFAELRASNGRYVSVGVVAFGLWAVAVSGAVFVGQTHSTNLDVVIAGALLMVSALAVVVGQRLSGPRATRPAKARSLVALVAWLVAGLVTLGSCVELIAEH